VVKEQGAVWPLQPIDDIIRRDVLQEGAVFYHAWIYTRTCDCERFGAGGAVWSRVHTVYNTQ
jgi:hypothetical protein